MKIRHISARQRLLFFLDELRPEHRRTVQNHLSECPRCRSRFAEERTFYGNLKRTRKGLPSPMSWKRWRTDLVSRIREKAATGTPSEAIQAESGLRWSFRPVPALALSCAVLVFGIILGRLSAGRIGTGNSPENAVKTLESGTPVLVLGVESVKSDLGRIRIRFVTTQENDVSGSLSDPNIQRILASILVSDGRDNIRLKTVEQLERAGNIHPMVQKALVHALKFDSNPGIRLSAARILASSVSKTAEEGLFHAFFNDPTSGVRIVALQGLKTTIDPNVWRRLEERTTRIPPESLTLKKKT